MDFDLTDRVARGPGEACVHPLAQAGAHVAVVAREPVDVDTGDPFRIVYLGSHVRTRHWYKGGEPVVWNSNGNAAYGVPKTRKAIRVLVASDLRNGYISGASARDVYGLSQAEIDVAVSIP